MTTQGPHVFDHTYTAENDLSAKQFYFVEYTGVDQVDLCDAATDRVWGVLMNDPGDGELALVRHLGIAKVVSDGSGTAIAAGDYVGSDANGKAVKKATTDYSVAGIAMDASSVDGKLIRVMLLPGAFFRTAAG